MFENAFQWTMRNGSRILFAFAVVTLVVSAFAFVVDVTRKTSMYMQQSESTFMMATLVYGYFSGPAYLLFFALVAHYLQSSRPKAD